MGSQIVDVCIKTAYFHESCGYKMSQSFGASEDGRGKGPTGPTGLEDG